MIACSPFHKPRPATLRLVLVTAMLMPASAMVGAAFLGPTPVLARDGADDGGPHDGGGSDDNSDVDHQSDNREQDGHEHHGGNGHHGNDHDNGPGPEHHGQAQSGSSCGDASLSLDLSYGDGFHEHVSDCIYVLTDAHDRVVISRPASQGDIERIQRIAQ
jgi:hypothetical protein